MKLICFQVDYTDEGMKSRKLQNQIFNIKDKWTQVAEKRNLKFIPCCKLIAPRFPLTSLWLKS
jgi:hypothetical protein